MVHPSPPKPPAILKNLGFERGSYKGWSYLAKSEEGIPKLIDRASVLLSSTSPNPIEACDSCHDITLPGNTRCLMYVSSIKGTLLGLLTPTSFQPFKRAFEGSLVMKAMNHPVVEAYALIERGGFLSRLETILVLSVDSGYRNFPVQIPALLDMPFRASNEVYYKIGKALGIIHNSRIIAGIESPNQILVRIDEGNVDVKIIAGKSYQTESVLSEQRECEDLVGANFLFHHAIAPIQRMRLLTAYGRERKYTREQLKTRIAIVADMTRIRALREWKVYPSDLPKKTSYLNLIRALDRHSEH